MLMILEHFVVGMLQTNCYLLGDPKTHEGVVIDPGGDSDRIIRGIKEHNLKLVAILLTHGHFDHVLDTWTLKEQMGGEVYLHPSDEFLLADRTVGLGALFTSIAQNTPKGEVDHWLKEGDQLEFGSIRFKVLETPGHTPGHVSFHFAETKTIFVGDTLFAGSIGRTDFPGGSYPQLIRSVREKIFTLDGTTTVYTGHGPETTVATEMKSNPFFR
jgi:glyoxylase-like metal-dependent hydrolase (beta-lactamase superfamily II)